jgi:hypothetical protein
MAENHSLRFVYCEDWYFPHSQGFIVAGYLEAHRTRCVLSPAWEKPTPLPAQSNKRYLTPILEEESSAPEPHDTAFPDSELVEEKGQNRLLFTNCLESPALANPQCH